MKRLTLTLVLIIAAFACTGIAAREDVLIPAMAETFENVVADYEGPRVDSLRDALATGDRAELFVVGQQWDELRVILQDRVVERVRDGEISPGVGQSLLERINLFDEAWRTVLSR